MLCKPLRTWAKWRNITLFHIHGRRGRGRGEERSAAQSGPDMGPPMGQLKGPTSTARSGFSLVQFGAWRTIESHSSCPPLHPTASLAASSPLQQPGWAVLSISQFLGVSRRGLNRVGITPTLQLGQRRLGSLADGKVPCAAQREFPLHTQPPFPFMVIGSGIVFFQIM